MGGLLGGKKKTKFSSESTTRTSPLLPDFLQQPIEDLSGRINELSLQEYSPYGGQRTADFSGDQLAAFAGVRGLQGKYDPLLTNASQLAMKLGEGITPESIQQFLNPYQQNVIDINKRNASTDFDKQLLDIQNLQKNVGSFGGSRTAIAESEARNNLNRLLSDIQTQGSHQGYESALQASLANQQLQQSSLAGMLNTASTGQGVDLGSLEALRQTGAQQQALSQAGLDVNYGDFLEQRQWPYQQAQFGLSGLLPIAELTRATVSKSNTEGSQTQSSGSGIGSALMGLATTAMGLPGVGSAISGALGLGGMGSLQSAILGSSAAGAGLNSNTLPLLQGGKLFNFRGGGQVKLASGGGVVNPSTFKAIRGSYLDMLRNSAFNNIQMQDVNQFKSIMSLLNPGMGKKPIQALEPMFRQYEKASKAGFFNPEPEEDFSKGYKMGEFRNGGLVKYAGGGKVENVNSHIWDLFVDNVFQNLGYDKPSEFLSEEGTAKTAESLNKYIADSVDWLGNSPEENQRIAKANFKPNTRDSEYLQNSIKEEEARLSANSPDGGDVVSNLLYALRHGEEEPEDSAMNALRNALENARAEEMDSPSPLFNVPSTDQAPKTEPLPKGKEDMFQNLMLAIGTNILKTLPEDAGLRGIGTGIEQYMNDKKEQARYDTELEMEKQMLELKKLNAQSLDLQNKIAEENLGFKKATLPLEIAKTNAEIQKLLAEAGQDPIRQKAVMQAVEMRKGLLPGQLDTTLEDDVNNIERLLRSQSSAQGQGTTIDPLSWRNVQ